MNKIEKKLKKDGQKIYLLKSEKDAIARSIVGDFGQEVRQKVLPGFHFNIFSFSFSHLAVTAVVIIFVAGVPLAYASQNSLPGDFLYNFEINILEEIEEKFYLSTEAKSQFYSDRLNERLEELEEVKNHPQADDFIQPVIENIREHSNSKLLALKDLEDKKDRNTEGSEMREDKHKDTTEELDELVEFLAVVEANEEVIKKIKGNMIEENIEDVTTSISNELAESIEEFTTTEEELVVITEVVEENLEDINAFLNETGENKELKAYIQSQLEEVKQKIDQGDFTSALTITTDTKVEIIKQMHLFQDEDLEVYLEIRDKE